MPALAVFVFLVPVRAVAQTNTVLVANTAGTPIPTVGAGYTVVQSPHVDINVSYHTNNATFSLGFRNVSGGTQYNGTNAIAYAVTNQRTTVPSATITSIRSTNMPIDPCRWWFFPWTSAAMAPPTVTNFVPGVVGRNHPRGRKRAMISAKLTPASTSRSPDCESKPRKRSIRAVSTTVPPATKAESP